MTREQWRRSAALIGLAVLAIVALVLVVMAITLPARTAVSATPSATSSQGVGAGSGPASSSRASSTGTATASAVTSATSAGSVRSSSGKGPLLVLGDGYSSGSSWAADAAARLGVAVDNRSQKGAGYHVAPKSCSVKPCQSFKDAADSLKGVSPSVVVIVGGEVDGDYDLHADATTTVTSLQKAFPHATIVLVTPISSRRSYPTWLDRHTETLKQVAEQTGALWVDARSVTSEPTSYKSGDLTPQASQQFASLLVASLKK